MKVEEKELPLDEAISLNYILGQFLDLHMDIDIMFDLSDCKVHLENITKNYNDKQAKVQEQVLKQLNVEKEYNEAIAAFSKIKQNGNSKLSPEAEKVINDVNAKVTEELTKMKNKHVLVKVPIFTKEIYKEQMETFTVEKYKEKAFVPTVKQIAIINKAINYQKPSINEERK